MPTELTKPVTRDSGLKRDGSPVYVSLVPTDDGGAVAFREKGKRGQGKVIPLRHLMGDAQGIKRTPVKPPAGEVDRDGLTAADTVDLGSLEARLMIDGEEVMTPDVKGRLWSIIREMREERREEMGLPPVLRGPSRKASNEKPDAE